MDPLDQKRFHGFCAQGKGTDKGWVPPPRVVFWKNIIPWDLARCVAKEYDSMGFSRLRVRECKSIRVKESAEEEGLPKRAPLAPAFAKAAAGRRCAHLGGQARSPRCPEEGPSKLVVNPSELRVNRTRISGCGSLNDSDGVQNADLIGCKDRANVRSFHTPPVIDAKCLEATDCAGFAGDPGGHICAKCVEATEKKGVESKRWVAQMAFGGKASRVARPEHEDIGQPVIVR